MRTDARWRVSDTGRQAHLVENGTARCGETGNGWRVVAGVPHCAICAEAVEGAA